MKPGLLVGAVFGAIVLLFVGLKSFVHVDAGEIVVVQNPVSGHLTWHTSPGPAAQWGGKVTKYHFRDQFWFSSRPDQGKKESEALKIRFNDGAHATISGSIAWEMPTDEQHLNLIHQKYGSHQNVENQLIATVIQVAVYMSGPLLSSGESYASRRNDLLNFISDQIENGVYKTQTREIKTEDPLTKTEKTTRVVELVLGKNGLPLRESDSPLKGFGIKTFNLSINEITYDGAVEQQIQAQQKAIMDIQTAAAKARTAEQDALTAEQEGKAKAAKAKWEQEVIKATEVTKAEQEFQVAQTNALKQVEIARLTAEAERTNAVINAERQLAVADLALKAALKEKEAVIAKGEGDAKARELVMAADGALEKKLAAYVEVNKAFAEAIRDYKGQWVPQTVMGASGTNGSPSADLINILTLKAARDLSLDITPTRPIRLGSNP